MANPIIQIENLHKVFKTEGGDVHVLRGISVNVEENDFAILYGPSGCGKSTLLHHIVGLEVPTTGNIWVGSTNIAQLTQEERAVFRSKNFGMVYQIWYWVKALNVWENVAMPLFVQGISESAAKKRAFESLEELGVVQYADKKPMQLSGGEQQRVGIARALVNDPLIIVADEPTGNLDTHASDQVMNIMQDLNKRKNRTVIMVTHNLIYLPIATKEISMRDGQLVKDNAVESPSIKTEVGVAAK